MIANTDPAAARRAMRWGALFQMPMLFAFVTMLFLYGPNIISSPWMWLGNIGAILFSYCLFRLYIRPTKKLLTSGLFKYTRHPMYTGLALMDTIFWLPVPVSHAELFFVLQTVFIVGLVAAAIFQEYETVYRFGREAEIYYAKTPRLFIMYPFTWCLHRRQSEWSNG